VKAATSGAKALQICAAEPPPDLVLLDVVMPGLSGYEVCRSLKADERTARIPVIFVTGLEDEGEEARGLSLGAVDFIRKPIDPVVVNERVAAHL
jgi:CheY-like chemotaxis protein